MKDNQTDKKSVEGHGVLEHTEIEVDSGAAFSRTKPTHQTPLSACAASRVSSVIKTSIAWSVDEKERPASYEMKKQN